MSTPEKDALLKQSKEDLVDCLLLTLEAQKLTTQNMQTMATQLGAAGARIKELEDQLASQEAELITLRNKL